ncbi:MAG: acetylglutamate kinase [Chloroflexi bacterium]|nr:acetylglutamate kinase [Chloroflexota bacterium]
MLEALPYLSRYVGKTVVVKVGGSVGDEGTVLEDLAWLRRVGVNPVVVHGGGALISHWLAQLGRETRFVEGRRYTDAETLDVVRMVLVGLVNNDLVAGLNALGVKAVGLSGVDGALLQARLRDERLGLVGDVVAVDLAPVEALLQAGYVVVVAPVGSGPGGQPLNINADSAAGALARALRAEKFILFTDVPGVLDRQGNLISQISVGQVRGLMESGVLRGGMIPKVEACVEALETVPRAHIIDGRVPHALLRELFTDQGVGTMIAHEG